MAVAQWVKEMSEDILGGAPFAVGDVVLSEDGRKVKITSGQYWGEHGLSNFWYWREVLPDGSLSEKEEHGYGWKPK